MKTLVVGCGGAGSNVVRNLKFSNKLLINTDSESDIPMVPKDVKGTKGDSFIGRSLAEDYSGTMDEIISEYDNIIIFAGLGGGTGTGMAPLLAERASLAGVRAVTIVSIPMEFEGRHTKAKEALNELISIADRIVLLDMDIIASRSQSGVFEEIISQVDNAGREIILRIVEMMHGPLFSILSEKAYTVSFVKGNTPEEKISFALDNPLYHADPTYGKAVIHTDKENYRHRDRISDVVCSKSGIIPEIINSDMDGMMVFIPVPSRP